MRTGNCRYRTCPWYIRGGYGAGVEPTTLWLKVIVSTKAPPRPTLAFIHKWEAESARCGWVACNAYRGLWPCTVSNLSGVQPTWRVCVLSFRICFAINEDNDEGSSSVLTNICLFPQSMRLDIHVVDAQWVVSVTCLSVSYLACYLYLPSHSLPSLPFLGWHYKVSWHFSCVYICLITCVLQRWYKDAFGDSYDWWISLSKYL